MSTHAGNDAAVLRRAQSGDRPALELFFRRELPALRRYAHAHVPRWLHRRADPDDLVQLAAIRTLRRLHHLDAARVEEVPRYMRVVLRNLVTDEVRRAGRDPGFEPLDEASIAMRPTNGDVLFGRAAWRAYRLALGRLPVRDRALVVGRLERGWSYERLAKENHRKSAGAARIAVIRALDALARKMGVTR